MGTASREAIGFGRKFLVNKEKKAAEYTMLEWSYGQESSERLW